MRVCDYCDHYYDDSYERIPECGHPAREGKAEENELIRITRGRPKWCPLRKDSREKLGGTSVI